MNSMNLEQIHIWAKLRLMAREDRNRFVKETVQWLKGEGRHFGIYSPQMVTFRIEIEQLPTFAKVSDKWMMNLFSTYSSFNFFQAFVERLCAFNTT
jgi:hypothetical protein